MLGGRILNIMTGVPSSGSGSFQSKPFYFHYRILTNVLPSGSWIVASTWMAYDFGSQILSGLEQAAGLPQKKTE
jgi:hypothetical protein